MGSPPSADRRFAWVACGAPKVLAGALPSTMLRRERARNEPEISRQSVERASPTASLAGRLGGGQVLRSLPRRWCETYPKTRILHILLRTPARVRCSDRGIIPRHLPVRKTRGCLPRVCSGGSLGCGRSGLPILLIVRSRLTQLYVLRQSIDCLYRA